MIVCVLPETASTTSHVGILTCFYLFLEIYKIIILLKVGGTTEYLL